MSDINPLIIKTVAASQVGYFQDVKDGLTELGLTKESKPKGLFAKFKHIASHFFETHEALHQKALMTQVLQKTIRQGNLEHIKYLIENMQYKSFGKSIVTALELENSNHSLEVMKYLIDDKTMPYHNDVESAIKKRYNPTYTKGFAIFENSCSSNNIALIDYWLSHEKFGKLINYDSYLNGVIMACKNNATDSLSYLLTDEKFSYKSHPDFDPQQLLYLVNVEKTDAIKYLIWELNIPKPENFEQFFSVNNLMDFSLNFRNRKDAEENQLKIIEVVKDIFDKREFYQNMQSDLEIKPINNKRPKI